jgi:hypothetical protein
VGEGARQVVALEEQVADERERAAEAHERLVERDRELDAVSCLLRALEDEVQVAWRLRGRGERR